MPATQTPLQKGDALRATLPQSSAPVWTIFGVTLFHVAVVTISFFVLQAVFRFPEILREPAQDRLSLFMENYDVIVPTYYFLALTGLTQAMIAVLLLLAAPRRDEVTLVLATMFGVLCGAFQIMGFIRWPIVIPYLADAMANAPDAPDQQIVTLMEGLMNRYAGMAIGEHLGFLGMGLWTLLFGVAILIQPFVDRRLGPIGIILGIVTLAVAMEPLGGVFEPFGVLVAGVYGVWTTWLVLICISLIRSRKGDTSRIKLPVWTWAIAAIYAASAVIPAYMG